MDRANASLFNGTTDTPIQSSIPGFDTGITGPGAWHNYAVRYDQPDNEIEIYVDGTTKGVIDLTTFAGGIYQGYSNSFVGAGGSGGNRTWTDNFQVGGNGALPGPHPDPGNITNAPVGLVSFWDFNEAAGPVPSNTLNFAYDRVGTNDGTFAGTATRTTGIVGVGAGQFNDINGDGVNVGSAIGGTSGIAIEAVFTTDWDGNDQAEFFRKEDGGNRILLSFQRGANINSAQLVGTAGVPGISLGLNIGGVYNELDVAFDGLDGRPTLAEVANGAPHHIVGMYDAASGVKSIYLDGQLIGSWNDVANSLTSGGGAPAFIGASGVVEPFDGVLDEVALYDRALTPGEINQHLANVLGGGANYFVPEPSSYLLAIFGLAAMGLMGFQQRRKQQLSKVVR